MSLSKLSRYMNSSCHAKYLCILIFFTTYKLILHEKAVEFLVNSQYKSNKIYESTCAALSLRILPMPNLNILSHDDAVILVNKIDASTRFFRRFTSLC